MDDIEHGSPQVVPEAERVPTKAEQASDLFTKGSVRYAGQTEAQITYVALKCKIEGLDPIELRDALIAESSLITEMTGFANRMHQKHRPKEEQSANWTKRIGRMISHYFNGEEGPPVLTEKDMIRTIKGVFSVAEERMKASPEQLRKILDEYDHFKNLPLHQNEKLDAYSGKVDEILAGEISGESPKEVSPAAKVKPARRHMLRK
jgi:hypothetical protein